MIIPIKTFSFYLEGQVNCSHMNSSALLCLLKVNETESCNSLDGNYKFYHDVHIIVQ